ncbi:MAG TPA: Swt1 family HEPN domain-containing protein [Pyrinomonadaceae bacterium]|nr:Swt1 family HEPN domain-containing protein [Pyrinomonadaceae bacterium]
MADNYVALYRGLHVFRNAMLPFLIERLRMAYGKEWWKAGVRRALGENVCDQLEANYQKRYDKTLPVVTRPGTELWEMLDTNRFLPIIEANWKGSFADVFKQRDQITVWLREINDVRNIVAHPESGDVPDQDTWRALDTIERLLQLINPSSAKQVSQLSSEIRDAKISKPDWMSLRDGPFDYEQGLAQLREIVRGQEGLESDAYKDIEAYRRQLYEIQHIEKSTPGVRDPQTAVRKESILRILEELALKYRNKSFTDLCLVVPLPSTPEDSLQRITALKGEIEKLSTNLYEQERKKLLQDKTGAVVSALERAISSIATDLAAKQTELAHLKEEATPAAFFSVKRKIVPHDRHVFAEEQGFEISVEVTNLGSKAVDLQYREGIPAGLRVSEGKTELSEIVAPGATVALFYKCMGLRVGQYSISTKQMEYEGRSSVWDQMEETEIEIRPGTEPLLIAQRYYRYEADSLKLLVRFENKGDKIARNVNYREEIRINGVAEPVVATFNGEIESGTHRYLVEHRLPVSDHTRVVLSDRTEITYNDSQHHSKVFVLNSEWKRVGYDFPRTPADIATVGREDETQLISQMVDRVWQVSRGHADLELKRLLFIEGIEGAGKTKLVHEVVSQAQERGFKCFVEDAKDRSPVKRMLRRLLGLRADEENDRLIWDRLKEHVTNKEQSPEREAVYRFISTVPTRFEKDQLDFLAANVLVLIKNICRREPMLLVFENIHWISEGAEEDLLVRLFQDTLVAADEPVLMCATFRPEGGGVPPIINKPKISRERYEQIQLRAIDENGSRALIDQIVDFPKLSEPLYNFVCHWSHGNPFYLIELLRLLLHPDSSYLVRVGSEWHPAPDARLEDAVPQNIEHVILARVEQELPSEANLAKVLSAIGFELPLVLVEGLARKEFPQWTSEDLYYHLDRLNRAGILTKPAEGSTKTEGYEFEHQLKREVLYATLPEGHRLHLRESVAEILLAQAVFPDPDEQIRQVARHIVRARREFRRIHLEEIVKAAELERDLRNFSRSLHFYDAAIELLPDGSAQLQSDNKHRLVELLVERSRLHQMRGYLIPAERDLEQAYALVSEKLAQRNGKARKPLEIRVAKERGRLIVKQHGLLDRANNFLYVARVGMEGPLRYRRYFPPHEKEFYRDLVEIYLALAELWLLKRKFKVCRKACKRAGRLAQRARKKLHNETLLPSVYMSLGDLYREHGGKQKYFDAARKSYDLALKHSGTDLYLKERVFVALADMARDSMDSDQAHHYYEEALQLQKQLGDIHGLAMSFGGIGGLLVQQGKFDEGAFYCEEAYKHQKRIGDASRFWRTCYSLAKIYRHKDDWERAKDYWLEARPILFGQSLLGSLTIKERTEIYNLICEFADHYHREKRNEEFYQFTKDKTQALPSDDRGEQASEQMELGEASFKVRKWTESIQAFEDALELTTSPILRAKAHERLGDIYLQYQPPVSDNDPEENLQNTAEFRFEKAVVQLIRVNDITHALRVYAKLLKRMMRNDAELWQLPLIFLRVLGSVSFKADVHDRFVHKTVELLSKSERHGEAGDILVYTARIAAKVDNDTVSLEKKLSYLDQAKEHYNKGSRDDLIWGLNMLIPTYFRLELWDKIVQCFEELFELYFNLEKPEEVTDFIDTFQALSTFEDQIDTSDLERFVNLALEGPKRMPFTKADELQLSLYVAKNYSHLAKKSADLKEHYNDLALDFLEKAKERVSSEEPLMMAVVLNDSALIYQSRQRDDEALSRLNEAIRLHQQFGPRGSAAICHYNRALIYEKNGRVDKALADFEQALEAKSNHVANWNERLKNQDDHPLSPNEIGHIRHEKHGLALISKQFASLLFRHENHHERANELADQAVQLYLEIGQPEDAGDTRKMAEMGGFYLGDKWAETLRLVEEMLRAKKSIGASDLVTQILLCSKCGGAILEGTTACSECGQRVCSACGAALVNEATKCAGCERVVCPQCGISVDNDYAKCPACETLLPVFCEHCGTAASVGDLACKQCGQPLD